MAMVAVCTCQEESLIQFAMSELIKTPENMGKSSQQQPVRCKASAECVSGRPERMRDHKDSDSDSSSLLTHDMVMSDTHTTQINSGYMIGGNK